MIKVELNKIVGSNVTRFNDNEEGEGQEDRTIPVTIAVDAVRCFNPRRDNRPGTRITFKDGGGFAVMEGYSVVKELLS